MKVCIPAMDQNQGNALICQHFGGTPFFAIYDSEAKTYEFVAKDESGEHQHGACNPVAALKPYNLDAIVVAGIGKNAVAKLAAAGIKVFVAAAVTVGENIELLLNNKLDPVDIDDCCGGHDHGGGCH